MSTDMGRGMDLLTARQRAEADTQRRQRAARRAYEGGDMTLRAIALMASCSERTLKRWIEEGGWKTLDSMVIRCHPDDEAQVMRKARQMLQALGATNIRKELPQ